MNQTEADLYSGDRCRRFHETELLLTSALNAGYLTITLEDSENLVSSHNLDLSDTVGVS